MSYQASTWALAQKVGSPSAKLVLLALANYADENGECWPRQTTLSRETEQSVDTVQRRLRDLERGGLIYRRRQAKANGWRGADAIVLLLDANARAYAEHHGYDAEAEDATEAGAAAVAMPCAHDCDSDAGGDVGDECDEIPTDEGQEAALPPPKPQIAVLAKAANCGVGQSRTVAAAVNNQNLNPIPPLNPPLPPAGSGAEGEASAHLRGWRDDWSAFEGRWDWAPGEDRGRAERAMRRLSPEDRALAAKWAGAQATALAERRVRKVSARDWLTRRAFADFERAGGVGRPARAFVRIGSPAWEAWEALWRRDNRMPATARMFALETTIDGERVRGTWRDTLFPPAPGTGPPGAS